MERYSEYKDSGVQWLGEIPGHWGIARLRHITQKIGSGSTPTGGSSVYVDQGVIFLRSQNIYNTGLYLDDVAYITESVHAQMKGTHVQEGDILYNITGGSIGRCCIAPKDLGNANVNQHVSIVRPSGNVENKYLLYNLQSWYCQNQMWVLQTGGNREGLSAGAFAKFHVALPPLTEQQSIVSYLDDKCAKIDALLEGKQKQIDLLAETKQRVIADAVTRGLNPNVKMKPTNIPWLPEIPEHWEEKRLATQFTGDVLSNKDFEYKHAFKFNYGQLVPKNEIGDPEEYKEVYVKYSIVQHGDILVNGLNLNYDFISQRVACAPSNGIITSAYVVCRPREGVNYDYYTYLFKAMDSMKLFHGMGTGIRLTLSFKELRKQMLPVPPLSEQRAIVSHIEAKVSKIDTLTAKLQQEIESIKEYKQRLISDVVTGQMKVS